MEVEGMEVGWGGRGGLLLRAEGDSERGGGPERGAGFQGLELMVSWRCIGRRRGGQKEACHVWKAEGECWPEDNAEGLDLGKGGEGGVGRE